MKKADAGFHDFVVHDLLADVPGIRSRRMFGGWGIYAGEKFFAIITGGQLYLKVRREIAEDFKKQGSKPFVYSRKDRKRAMLAYWNVPEDILENREEFREWIDKSIRSL